MIVGWSGGVPKAVTCGERAKLHSSYFQSFFEEGVFSIFFDLGWILGGFGRPKWRPKSIFGRLLFEVRFGIDFGSIFGGSEPQTC